MSFAKLTISSLTLLLLVGTAQGWARGNLPGDHLKITPEMIRFTYSPFENGELLPCTHYLESPAGQDWRVRCSNPSGSNKRDFRVHLWVTRYRRESAPKFSVEVLYWVTDLTIPSVPKGTGTTVWFRMNEESGLYGVSVSQSVENDTAGLYLEMVNQ